MKKMLMVSMVTLASMAAQADIIKCVFTEPFINSTYSMTQSTLTYTDNVMNTTNVIKNVSFQIKGAGKFELVAKNGKVLQRLVLNYHGSDGMSDFVYPYSVKDFSMDQNANNGIGGCSSNYLKPIVAN